MTKRDPRVIGWVATPHATLDAGNAVIERDSR